jgi:mono/diheme cytochrome c family protein
MIARCYWIFLASWCSLALLFGAPQAKKLQRVSATPTTAIQGADLFTEFCAVCHGTDARGGGPAASALKKLPADLTQITRRNNGKFPAVTVKQIINGDSVVAAHGSRDMPTWGHVLRGIQPNPAVAELRVTNLVRYLEQIQAK